MLDARHRKPVCRAARLSLAARYIGLPLLFGLLSVCAPLALPPARAAPPDAPSDTSDVADPYAAHIAEAAQRYGIPQAWIRAVMQAESDGLVHAVSSVGAMGLMQIMPGTWNELRARYGLGDDPFDPRHNILAGAAYLRELHDRYGAPGSLAAYNAGPARYDEYLATGHPLPAETIAFVMTLAPFVGSNGAEATAAISTVDREDWTRAPLFVTGSHGAPAPRSDGLFVTRSDGGDGR